jgi:holo-[acyl-carrier protein] synthase
MILGIGSDLIDIRRIEKSLARFGARFEGRVFAESELRKADSRPEAGNVSRAATLAKRFAAKEACAKALGTGFRHGVFWKDMVVFNQPSGKPGLRLSGAAAQHLETLTPCGMKAQIDLTMTDEYPMAQAFVIISAVAA